MRNASTVLRPLVSEKSFRLAALGQYSFIVDRSATAADIRHAIELLYSVRVTSVRTMNIAGKFTRYKGYAGRRNHWKKAMITLAAGQSIDGFTAIASEETAPQKDPEKTAKRSRGSEAVSTKVRTGKAQKSKANEVTRSSSSGQSPKDVE